MAAVDFQFFNIADDAPVEAGLFRENTKFHQTSAAPQHIDGLDDRFRAAAGFQHDVATDAAGERFHLRYHIFFHWVDAEVGAGLFGDSQPVLVGVNGDQLHGIFQFSRLQHQQSDRTAAG